MPQRRLGVSLDAVRALGNVRYRDGDDLLNLGRQRALRENLLAEGMKGRLSIRR